MAAIESEAFVGTKKWSEGAMWKGGVAPGIKDEAILTAGAGNVEVTTAVKAKSLDCTNYKATFTLNEKTLQLGAELEGAGSVLKWGTGMKVTAVGAGKIEIPSAKSCTPEITTNGAGEGRIYTLTIKASAGKIKLVDAFIIQTGTLEILRCSDFLTENNSIEVPFLVANGALATTLHFGTSVVSTGTGLLSFGEGVTLTANEATFQSQGTEFLTVEAAKNHTLGTIKGKGRLVLRPTGNAPKSFTVGALKLENGGNAAAENRTLVLAEGTTVIVTGAITTDASTEANRVVIESSIAGKAAKLKKATGKVELDYIEVIDCTAEGEIPFQALSHSVLGTGNTNWELVGSTVIKGKATGTLLLTGTAKGTATQKVLGQATGALLLTGTAKGSLRAVVTASATGTLLLTGTAKGIRAQRVKGSATGTLYLTGRAKANQLTTGKTITFIFEEDFVFIAK